MKTQKEILDSLSTPSTSKWRERAEWRYNNRQWLRKSHKIALTILEFMHSNAISQKDLSDTMTVSPQYVSKILKGSENLSLETICKLEEALGIELMVIPSFVTEQIVPAPWTIQAKLNKIGSSEKTTTAMNKSDCYNWNPNLTKESAAA